MLTRWNPFWEIGKFERDFCDLFSIPPKATWAPRIDISEDDSRILIEAEIPGLAPEDVELVVEDGILTLKGKKSLKKDQDKRSFLVSERASGSFTRSFTLPSSIEINEIRASYDKGMLIVEVPKKPPKIPKKIKINISS